MRASGHCCRLSRGPNRKLDTGIGSSPISGGGIGCTPGSWNHGNLGTPPFSYRCRCISSAADAPVMHQIGDWATESHSAQWITPEPACDQAPRIPYALAIGHFHTHAGLFRFPRMLLLWTKSEITAPDWIWSVPSTSGELEGNSLSVSGTDEFRHCWCRTSIAYPLRCRLLGLNRKSSAKVRLGNVQYDACDCLSFRNR